MSAARGCRMSNRLRVFPWSCFCSQEGLSLKEEQQVRGWEGAVFIRQESTETHQAHGQPAPARIHTQDSAASFFARLKIILKSLYHITLRAGIRADSLLLQMDSEKCVCVWCSSTVIHTYFISVSHQYKYTRLLRINKRFMDAAFRR